MVKRLNKILRTLETKSRQQQRTNSYIVEKSLNPYLWKLLRLFKNLEKGSFLVFATLALLGFLELVETKLGFLAETLVCKDLGGSCIGPGLYFFLGGS